MFKAIYNNIQRYWSFLIGDTQRFTLESRIFHIFSIIAVVTVSLEATINIFLSLYVAAVISSVILIVQSILYYVSRVKNRLKLAVVISAIEVNLANAFAYFYNSGLTGSTLLLSAVSLFLVILVVNKKQWFFWFLVNVIVVLSVVYCEYKYPESIQKHYGSRLDMFADITTSYIMVITLLFVCTVQIRKNYHLQKFLADEKALKLEILNNEKDKLFSIISHDLNSPLASVRQYFDLLAQVDLTLDERSKVEQDLLKAIGGAQDLLNNLLQWAKSQMQHVNMYLQPVKLKQHLVSTIAMIEQVSLKKQIRLIVNIDDHIIVNADINMLQLIIRNLLYNAVKFTHSKGQIELNAVIMNGYCIISVIDNGIGIPLDKQGSIFSLNVRSTYGTVNEKGTGLGLMLCKDYTLLQGGDIWFTSSQNSGTTFYLSLPVFS